MARKVADNPRDFHADAAVPCAHQTCGVPAMCKVKTKTGWANLCPKHYEYHFADEANANLDKHGLARLPDETNHEHVARMREFVRRGFRRISDRQYEKAA